MFNKSSKFLRGMQNCIIKLNKLGKTSNLKFLLSLPFSIAHIFCCVAIECAEIQYSVTTQIWGTPKHQWIDISSNVCEGSTSALKNEWSCVWCVWVDFKVLKRFSWKTINHHSMFESLKFLCKDTPFPAVNGLYPVYCDQNKFRWMHRNTVRLVTTMLLWEHFHWRDACWRSC